MTTHPIGTPPLSPRQGPANPSESTALIRVEKKFVPQISAARAPSTHFLGLNPLAPENLRQSLSPLRASLHRSTAGELEVSGAGRRGSESEAGGRDLPSPVLPASGAALRPASRAGSPVPASHGDPGQGSEVSAPPATTSAGANPQPVSPSGEKQSEQAQPNPVALLLAGVAPCLSGLPSLDSVLLQRSAEERMRLKELVSAKETSAESCAESILKIPAAKTERELVLFAQAFARTHIEAAALEGKPLVILVAENHLDPATARVLIAIMAELKKEFGSNVTYSIEQRPDLKSFGFLQTIQAGLPQAAAGPEAAAFDKSLWDRVAAGWKEMDKSKDTAKAHEVSSQLHEFSSDFAHRLGYFRTGFDIDRNEKNVFENIAERDPGMLKSVSDQIAAAMRLAANADASKTPEGPGSPRRAFLIGGLGAAHGPFLFDGLKQQGEAHVACLASLTGLATKKRHGIRPELVGQASYMIHHPDVTRFRAEPKLAMARFSYLSFARTLGCDLSLSGEDSVPGERHAEQVLQLAGHLASMEADPETYRQQLGEQQTLLTHHIDKLVKTVDEKQGDARLRRALQLQAAIYPVFETSDTPLFEKEAAQKTALRLINHPKAVTFPLELGRLEVALARALTRQSGKKEEVAEVLSAGVKTLRALPDRASTQRDIVGALRLGSEFADALDRGPESWRPQGNDLRQALANALLPFNLLPKTPYGDTPSDQARNARGRERLQSASKAVLEAGADPRVVCHLLEAGAFIAAAEGKRAEAHRLLKKCDEQRESLKFPRMAGYSAEAKALEGLRERMRSWKPAEGSALGDDESAQALLQRWAQGD